MEKPLDPARGRETKKADETARWHCSEPPECRQTPATVDFRFGILYCGPIRVMLTIQ